MLFTILKTIFFVKSILLKNYGEIIKSFDKKKKYYKECLNNNLQRRLDQLRKLGIIKVSTTGIKKKTYSYSLNLSLTAFKKIVSYLDRRGLLSKLVYTKYFKQCGFEHVLSIFNKLPEGFLDIDLKDPEQWDYYKEYTYNRLINSPTFMKILISPNLGKRLALLQNSLEASYLRQQAVKGNFPFVQLLGTFCSIIDYLEGVESLNKEELGESCNDIERIIYKQFKSVPELPDLKTTEVKRGSKHIK